MKRGVLAPLLAVPPLIVALVGLCLAWYSVGHQVGQADSVRAEAARQQAITKALQADAQRGERAAAELGGRLEAMTTRYTQLKTTFHDLRRRVPLVVPAPVRTLGAQRCDGGSPDGADRAAGHAAPDDAQQPDAGARDHLSGLAVWMWNSTLAGADVPAGACGTAGATEQACAADTGVTLDDAWANHRINAKSCAADRERHQALIDYLKTQQQPLGDR